MDKILALTISEMVKGFIIGGTSGIFVFLLFGNYTVTEFAVFLILTMMACFIVTYKINKKIY